MFGPLPALHRLVLVVGALLVGAGTGFWLGAVPEVPLDLRAGLVAGTAAGIAAAFVLVHDFHHRQARPVRVRRRTR